MKPLPIDTSVELFKWGPVGNRAYYGTDFVEQMYPSMPAPYEAYAFPKAIFIFKGERTLWVNEFPEVRERGRKAFENVFRNDADAATFRKAWDKEVQALTERENELSRERLASFGNEEFTRQWKEFYALLSDFWVPGIVVELANYASDEVLRDELRPFITDEKERDLALSVLAVAESTTFFQEEELALAETNDVAAHQRAYHWIHNSYSRVEEMPVSFFAERKQALSPKLREEYAHQLKEARAAKEALRSRYGLPESVMKTAEALWRTLMWQDERKMHILRYLHYKKLFLEEAAKRLGVPFDSLLAVTSRESPRLLEDPSVREAAARRGEFFGWWLSEDEGEVELDEATVRRFWDVYAEPKTDESVREFKGTVVSKGSEPKVQGTARIRLSAYDAEGFAPGDILVAPMTSPEYVFLMKQSGAIVTDTGGLMSHAAVVSREMGKLCVVNAKVATQVLKDGDLVEVDAEKGIVRKI